MANKQPIYFERDKSASFTLDDAQIDWDLLKKYIDSFSSPIIAHENEWTRPRVQQLMKKTIIDVDYTPVDEDEKDG